MLRLKVASLAIVLALGGIMFTMLRGPTKSSHDTYAEADTERSMANVMWLYWDGGVDVMESLPHALWAPVRPLVSAGPVTDGWGRVIEWKLLTDVLSARSRGQDGVFGTLDDITMSMPVPGRQGLRVR